MSTNLRLVSIGAVTASIAAAWLGASVYASSLIEAEIRAFAARPSSETGLRILDLKHTSAFLSSSGSFRLQSQLSDPKADPKDIPTLDVAYDLSNLLLPASAARLTWTMNPSGIMDAAITAILGSRFQVQGSGQVNYKGGLDTSVAIPAITINQDGTRITIPATSGHMAADATTLSFGLGFDKILASGNGETLDLAKLAVQVDLTNRVQGLGATTLSFEKLTSADGSAEGFRHTTEVSQSGDRINIRNSDSLRSLTAMGQNLSNLTLDLAVTRLDAASLQKLGTRLGNSSATQSLTSANGDADILQALRILLSKGFTVGISKLSGTVGKGSFSGKLSVELAEAPSPSAPLALAKRLRASGDLLVKGDIVPEAEAKMAVENGLAKSVPDGLKAEFVFANGVLKTNGSTVDANTVETTLASTESGISDVLNGTPLSALDRTPAAEAAPGVAAADAAPGPSDQGIIEPEDYPDTAAGAPAPGESAAAPAADAANGPDIAEDQPASRGGLGALGGNRTPPTPPSGPSGIKDALVGNTVAGTMIDGGAYSEFYSPNGSIQNTDGATGRWRIKNNAMCFRYGQDPESCLSAEIDGRNVNWLDENGKTIGQGTITRGNPNQY